VRRAWHCLAGAALLLPVGCDNMANQPKRLPYELPRGSHETLHRVPPEGIVARDEQSVPVPPVTEALLVRGQERYDIYCAPCHDRTGSGHGMIVQRGFPAPPSYHIARLREAPVRHFYDVISNGYGAMYRYADRVAPADRWAIIAYIRALQASQHASLAELPESARERLK
jgi:mono/diheme cytochrome c family protein